MDANVHRRSIRKETKMVVVSERASASSAGYTLVEALDGKHGGMIKSKEQASSLRSLAVSNQANRQNIKRITLFLFFFFFSLFP